MDKHRPGPGKVQGLDRDRFSSLSCQLCEVAPPNIIIIDLVAIALLSVSNVASLLTLFAQNGESVYAYVAFGPHL